jgi:hypothetical protein
MIAKTIVRFGVLAMVALQLILGLHGAVAQQGTTVELTVHYRKCDEVPPNGDYFNNCHDNPVADSLIQIFDGNTEVASGDTGADGNVTFPLFAGTYTIMGAPGDFLDATEIFCSRNDAPGVEIAYPLTLGTGDQVTCDYYIVPTCNDADGDCTPESIPATITATVYNCPAGMTPDALVGDDCALATTGFSIAIFNLTGKDEFLTLDDATFDGSSYLWSPGPAATEAFDSANYGIRETVLPGGYVNFAIYGSNVVDAVGDIVHLRISRDAPDAQVMIYNFAPAGDDDDDGTPVTQLPSTGTGSSADQSANPILVLIAAAVLLSGVVVLRRRTI